LSGQQQFVSPLPILAPSFIFLQPSINNEDFFPDSPENVEFLHKAFQYYIISVLWRHLFVSEFINAFFLILAKKKDSWNILIFINLHQQPRLDQQGRRQERRRYNSVSAATAAYSRFWWL
jgi:hypothetical protein